ncbi:MAG: 30S ribosomal protein S6 [SAR202 cluster bacterium]|nr:30S ribosomal protein S6 [SAR202 cluster bacterium]
MRHYELVVVLSPMLNQEQVTETWDRVKGFITNRDGEINHEEQWGTRRLAYPIRKGQHQFLEGSYHLTRFQTEQSFNKDLENFLKVDEEIIRSMVTVTLPEDELAAQAAAAARAIRTPPPRPAVGPDGAPIAPPAEGVAPAAAPAGAAESTPAAQATEAPAAAEPAAAPEASLEASVEATEPEPEPEPAAEAPAAEETAEEPEEPASGPDESEA